MEIPLVDKEYLLEKFPGKGGWTYIFIPEIVQDKRASFGWVKVRGAVGGYPLVNQRLMPMGEKRLFLPVNAALRRAIGKKEGDRVHVILHADLSPLEIPDELRSCLLDEPQAYSNFLRFSEAEQKAFIDWIYSAKTEETRISRITKMLDKATRGEKLINLQ